MPTFPHDIYGNSEVFHEKMKARMKVSHYKYGSLEDNYPFHVDALASLELRLAKYREDGNVEWLVDVANFAMIEALYPSHIDAHFKATSSDESPGIVKG